ncbi:MAG TPA: hypothetical protein VIV61_17720 [Candidatus Ozemobacteraceae bacterium]
MTTSFEFLARDSRRIHVGRVAPAAFLGTSFVVLLTGWLLSGAADRAQTRYKQEAEAIEQRQQELAAQAAHLVPSSARLDELERRIALHNEALIGPRIDWTRLFSLLDEALPPEAIITNIANAVTGEPVFNPGDRDFRLTVAVENADAINRLYMNLLSTRSFEGLSFTPKNDAAVQGRAATLVEIVFRFTEGD